MKNLLNTFIALFLFTSIVSAQSDQELTTVTKLGQLAPHFSCESTQGEKFDLAKLKGKVVVLDFFATWCPPCMKELPELEKQIWKKFKNQDVIVLAIGREHKMEEMKKFQKKKGFTFPICPDPDRSIYTKYATKYIPRNVVIDKDGKIIYQSSNYTPKEFKKMIKSIKSAL